MKNREIKVTFQPTGRRVFVLPGTLLLEAAARAGIARQTPCGGRATCGKCQVRVLDGRCSPSAVDHRILSVEQVQRGFHLACQSYIDAPLVVEVPAESRLEAAQQMLPSNEAPTGRESTSCCVTLVEPDDLDGILLAGAFGNFIRRSNARRIGLLPQIPCGRIHFIGNAAAAGAKLVLLSTGERAERLRGATEHVDLSLDLEFQMELGMAMMFPEADVDVWTEGLPDEEPYHDEEFTW